MSRVDTAERAGALERWAQEDAPTAVMPPGQEPSPGTIDGRRHWPELDITMLELGNGMKVSPGLYTCFLASCGATASSALGQDYQMRLLSLTWLKQLFRSAAAQAALLLSGH